MPCAAASSICFRPGSTSRCGSTSSATLSKSIRTFDAETQRTLLDMRALDLVPVSEFQLVTETIRRFRMGYVATFGAPQRDDLLYEAVSEGRRHPGMEHWLPLFQERMDTLFDYLDGAPVAIEPQGEDAARERFKQIEDYYEARREALEHPGGGAIYKPLPPDRLYLTEAEWTERLNEAALARLTPFAVPDGSADVFDAGARQGRNFTPERADGSVNVFEAVVAHVLALQAQRKKVVITLWSEGSRDRMGSMLRDHKLANLTSVNAWRTVQATPRNEAMLAVVGMESGFETDEFAVITEQDILGDRLVRPRKSSRKLDNFISEVTSLSTGDLVVHVEHGIGRFVGLQTIEVGGAPHDCLELHYAAETKLFLPVENIELLSRYGSDHANVELDRLGGGGWQARKAKLKNRIREIAGELIKIAAERHLHEAPKMPVQPHVYDEFCARFPYEETEDQLGAITSTLKDLESGRPMDRLICGDVGFGKTEVALRAAFAVALDGKQVAVVVPTTLLARQHSKNFAERFRGFPVNVAQASRLIPAKELTQVKKGLTDGNVDIVVGTHALLGKSIKFRDLGLLIVDEEQHFGVSHKERLKQLRAQVHVLTLSATPIPRTLQLALTGVRDLSIIASPPVDRLAVRTFVAPHDPLMIREALLRERYRGGQAFYVVPRIEDLAGVKDFLDKNVPEMKVAVAHGQMPPTVIEDIMSAFYDGKYDILLSTTIIESGLDIPTANTLIVHRADMFGLAQLYQLRGRVGRSKLRAYALFTLPAQQKITAQAERRLKVLQSLETLGAGFQLASHDLDIRGAGNLLGEEQSGHIKEVGFELYQSMLEEAILNLKAGVVGAGRRPLVAADHHRHAGADPRGLRQRPRGAAVAVPAARRSRDRRGDRQFRRRNARPLRRAAGRSPLSLQGRGHQGLLPPSQCREGRCRTEGRRDLVPRQQVRAAGSAGVLHPPARPGRQGATGHEGGVPADMEDAGGAVDGHDRDLAATRQSRGEQEGGVAIQFVGEPERHCERARSNPLARHAMDCLARSLASLACMADKANSRRHCCRRPFSRGELIRSYFGYLNSGAAFSASLVVFIVATHLSFLVSRLTLTEDGDTAT